MATDYRSFYICLTLTFIVLCGVGSTQGNRFFTTPPNQGYPRPTIINGKIHNLYHIPVECQYPQVYTYPTGGVIIDPRALIKAQNPHQIAGNIEIAPTGCLYIEPGSVLQFSPGYGIRVNGTLIAWGSPDERITFTKDPNESSAPWPEGSRLVDGNATLDGRLEVMYHGKWRGVCTNYVNFTKIDADVTCRSFGFLKGNFTYHSFAKNVSNYILFEMPSCKGTEDDLMDCPGQGGIRMGRHVCDGQQVIGFKCEGFRTDLAQGHWRGIEFINSTFEAFRFDDNLIIRNESLSRIEYADISYAGVDTLRDATKGIRHPMATISASPHAPNINEITLKYGAHDGFNYTEIQGSVSVANSTISHNRGHGMLIRTTVGRTLVNTTNITNNWGDGIKFHMDNYTIVRYEDRFTSEEGSFCGSIVARRPLPAFLYQDLRDLSGSDNILPGRPCKQRIITSDNLTITVHFLLFEKDPRASGSLKLYDGQHGPLLQTVEVQNGSYPQSVTTTGSELYMEFHFDYPKDRKCPTYKHCLRFLLEVYAQYGPDSEFRLINSSVSNNSMHGVNIHDMRSKVFFNTTEVSFNRYEAGIRIYQGTGEITINNTLIESNELAGVNITYSGGYILMNNTRLLENRGYGVITEYDNVNKTRYEIRQEMEVVRCAFELNEWTAFRIGNYCKQSTILVNESRFAYNFEEGIEFLSCNRSNSQSTNFSLAFNDFHNNERHSVLVSPMLYVTGIMTNNTFSGHNMGVVRFDNGQDLLISRWYADFPVNYNIFENEFEDNSGRYVASICLTQSSPLQKLHFKFNKVTNNYINETFNNLNPRSRANAVVVLSSRGIVFERNWIENPESVREISTHLTDPSVVINATRNWWGTISHEEIYNKIFDQDDRYNLARIQYYPALSVNRLYEDYTTEDQSEHIWQFNRENLIGGLLERTFETNDNIKEYYVDKDIYIRPGAFLSIRAGTTLYFGNSLGLITYGRLVADGVGHRNSIEPVVFTVEEMDIVIENVTASVRVEDGADQFEGRLEVELDGVWGTVCNEGWVDNNAVLACQQLGLTYNPKYSTPRLKIIGRADQPVHMADVHCGEMDLDLAKCRADILLETSPTYCNHSQDVFLRCHPPTWSGIKIPAVPMGSQRFETQIRHVIMRKAGLMDAATMEYSPALGMDYNYHVVTNLTVEDGVSDGIDIKFTHPVTENRLESCTIRNNLGSGIVTRDTGLEISYTFVTGSGEAGLRYDPSFTEVEALNIRNSIHPDHRFDILTTNFISIGDGRMKFLVTNPTTLPNGVHEVELDAGLSYRVTLQILDYNPIIKRERVTIFDSRRNAINSQTPKWEIEDDLVDFPITASSRYLTIRVQAPGVVSGRLTFAAHSRRFSTLSSTQLYVRNCTFSENTKGIVTNHYNNPSNYKQDIFFRHKNEVFDFEIVVVSGNVEEAMYIPSVTKYGVNDIPSFEEMTRPQKVAVIKYILRHCEFTNNGIGIVAEHNHVDFANNAWHWQVTFSKIIGNTAGGFEMELPRVNDRLEREIHTFKMGNTVFQNNKNFAFTINGYYANVSISLNTFKDNVCRLGLVTISGMEKGMDFSGNVMTSNTGRYMVDFDMDSHSEYYSTVNGLFRNNDIRNNMPDSHQSIGNEPRTYAVAFRGVLNVVANRNLLENINLQYELVAGVTALSLENTMDVKENWWGSTNQLQVRQRIFDFDDWNNFAIAEYTPFLDRPAMNAETIPGTQIDTEIDLDNLGGRIHGEFTIPYKSQPYIVYSDLTVMPEAILKIPAGVEFQFQPNIGILVLGILEARGLPYNRIKMGPVKKAVENPVRKRRDISTNLRLLGGMSNDEGFLELYNTTSKSYNLMCDTQFNEKTAEVVCRQLGKETINVEVRFSHLYDYYVYGRPMFFRKEFWANSFYCKGNEDNLDQCKKRINYNLLPCVFAANYIFIRCGKRNLEKQFEYWGNIRFAPPSYEEKSIIIDDPNRKRSSIEYVDITGAGILHGEKVGAIQATYLAPKARHLNVTNCASNALDYIAPRENLEASTLNVTNNLGYGLNVLVLNGESSESLSSFKPLLTSSIPYNLFGMVDICRMEKTITIKERMILYYKYNHKSIDCVKIITSSSVFNRVSLRFLQINLYNDPFSRNTIEIFDGTTVSNETMLAEITASSPGADLIKSYTTTTTEHTLAVHIHASPGQWTFGFIAEVVTLPQSGLSYPDSRYSHRLDNSMFKGNKDGAILYRNVGEVTPSLFIERCWIENNGVAILNLTSWPVIDIGIQGTRVMKFTNNFVNKNRGGMQLVAKTSYVSTSANITITNNIFSFTTNGEALNVSGHHYQRVYVYENDFFNNTAGDWRNVVNFEDVLVNFTNNMLTNNYGHHVLAAFNTEAIATQQLYTKNILADNNASADFAAAIFAGRGRPKIVENYVVNPLCAFELLAGNKAVLPDGRLSTEAPLNATNNWWGSWAGSYITSKLWDENDNDKLRPVVHFPAKPDNLSFLEGKCPAGWRKEGELCYRYLGGALNYDAARTFCTDQGGYLAITRDRERFLNMVVKSSQAEYDSTMKVWVYGEVAAGRCSALRGIYTVEEEDCSRIMLPFICERDPYIAPPGPDTLTLAMAIGFGVAAAICVIVIILVILWYIKSKRRKEERFERRASIRSSVRSARSKASLAGITDRGTPMQSRARSMDTLSVQGPRGVFITGVTSAETSTETLDKPRLDAYYFDRSNPSTPGSKGDLYNNRTDHYVNGAFYNGGSTDDDEKHYDEDEGVGEDENYEEDEFDDDETDDVDDGEDAVSQKTTETSATSPDYDRYGNNAPPPYQLMPPRLENEISSLRRTPDVYGPYSNTSIEDRSVDLSSDKSRSGVSLSTFGSHNSVARPPTYQKEPSGAQSQPDLSPSHGNLQHQTAVQFSQPINDPSQRQASLPSVRPLYRRREIEENNPVPPQVPPPFQPSSRNSPAPYEPHSRNSPAPYQPQSRNSPAPYQPQSRNSPAPYQPQSRNSPAPYQPQSRNSPAPYQPQSRNSPAPYQPQDRNSPAPYQPPNRNSPVPYQQTAIDSPAPYKPSSRNSPVPYQQRLRESPSPSQPGSRNSPAPHQSQSRSSPALNQPEPESPASYQPSFRHSYQMSAMDEIPQLESSPGDRGTSYMPRSPQPTVQYQPPTTIQATTPVSYEELEREPFSAYQSHGRSSPPRSRGSPRPSETPSRASPAPDPSGKNQPLETSM